LSKPKQIQGAFNLPDAFSKVIGPGLAAKSLKKPHPDTYESKVGYEGLLSLLERKQPYLPADELLWGSATMLDGGDELGSSKQYK